MTKSGWSMFTWRTAAAHCPRGGPPVRSERTTNVKASSDLGAAPFSPAILLNCCGVSAAGTSARPEESKIAGTINANSRCLTDMTGLLSLDFPDEFQPTTVVGLCERLYLIATLNDTA